MPSLDDINLRQFYIYDSNQNDTLNTAMTFLANNTFSRILIVDNFFQCTF